MEEYKNAAEMFPDEFDEKTEQAQEGSRKSAMNPESVKEPEMPTSPQQKEAVKKDTDSAVKETEREQSAEFHEKKAAPEKQAVSEKQEMPKKQAVSTEHRENDREDLEVQIAGISADISEIKTRFKEFTMLEKTVDYLKMSVLANQRNEENMAKELSALKKGERFTLIKPFLETMIYVHSEIFGQRQQYIDDKEKVIQDYTEKAYNEIVEMFDFLLRDLENRMAGHGLNVVECRPGEKYIPMKQSIVKTVLTNNVEENEMVAVVKSACYMYEDKVLRPAKVHVYRYEQEG